VASFEVSAASGSAPLLVAFDGTASEDPDGTIVGYHWDFGDGSAPQMGFSLSTIGYRFDTPGTYTVTLTVTDDADLIGRATMDIEVLP
jgi:PKD repeat protein